MIGWLIVATDARAPGSQTEAARYFHLLGALPGAGAVTDFRQHDRDGMQNEDASGSYRTTSSATAILDHYRAACRRIGLTAPPSAETLGYYPTALCDGPVIVTVTPACTRRHCNVFVEVIG
ncbi:MAG: hypothetical protein PGN21_16660 [Sphingomonas paucimobilis]